MLISGEYFDHLAPDRSVISLEVLAAGLRAWRFNCQTTRLISVAEHCLRVRRIVRGLGGNSVCELRALLHDAPEALVPWGDCLRPGKTDEMREVEGDVLVEIYEALGISSRRMVLTEVSHGDFDLVKVADNIALYFEAMLWQPGSSDWADPARKEGWDRLGAVDIASFLPTIAPVPGEDWATEVRVAKSVVRRGTWKAFAEEFSS